MIRWSGWVAVACVSCATPVLHPSSIQVKELDWGVYEQVDGEEVHVRTPDRADRENKLRSSLRSEYGRYVKVPRGPRWRASPCC
jgi:hypothetical protein